MNFCGHIASAAYSRLGIVLSSGSIIAQFNDESREGPVGRRAGDVICLEPPL